MTLKKQAITIFAIGSLVIAGTAAITPSKPKHKNLKILPADISDKKLDSIMQSYNVALGVSCDFCHSPMKGVPDSLDYAADDKPMKEEARKMLRMTIEINKTNFYFDKNIQPEYLKVVHCMTCHRGEAYPEIVNGP